jgi:hypothetical protein
VEAEAGMSARARFRPWFAPSFDQRVAEHFVDEREWGPSPFASIADDLRRMVEVLEAQPFDDGRDFMLHVLREHRAGRFWR